MLEDVRDKIESILKSDMDNISKRKALNEIEKKYPQDLFIKTHLCNACNSMDIEIWVKEKQVSLKS